MSENIPQDLYSIVKDTLEECEEFSIELCSEYVGKGYSGELVPLKLTQRKSQQKQYVVLKYEQKTSDGISKLFESEIIFYSIIWPTLRIFYKNNTGKDVNLIPKCFGTCKNEMRAIIMENLKTCNYQLHDKKKPFDITHLEMIFKMYGKFHGISMALKGKHPEQFQNLLCNIRYQWQDYILKDNSLGLTICFSAKSAQTAFDPGNERDIIERLVKFEENGPEIVTDMLKKYSHHRIFTHGDCWNNNLMFKYDENGQLEDMKLIDFQIVSVGSPVHDLSYCFYSSTNSYTGLEYFLKIYHSSLSNTLIEFGLDIEEIYSYDTLLAEWKEQSKFGFLLALMIWKVKFAEPNAKPLILKDNKLVPWNTVEDKIDEYNEAIRNLVLHMYDNGFI